MAGRKKKEETVISAAENAIEEALFKEYKDLFSKIPDRRANLLKIGIPGFDHILGGGLPRGQMIHVYGKEGSGKSTLAQHVCGAVRREKRRYYFVDPENSIDSTLANTLGLDVEDYRSYTNKIPSAEYVLDAVEKFVRAGTYGAIIFDTVAALTSAKTLASSNEKDDIGIKARMMSKAIEKLNNAAVNNDTIILFVNQLRANIQVGPHKPFTTPGGMAVKFFPNINILTTYIGPIKDGERQIGQQVKIKVEKNKVAAPFQETTCNLIYGYGFRRDMDLILNAQEQGFVDLAGSWYSYKGTKLGQGLKSVVHYAKENPSFLDDLEQQLYGNKEAVVATPAVTTEE